MLFTTLGTQRGNLVCMLPVWLGNINFFQVINIQSKRRNKSGRVINMYMLFCFIIYTINMIIYDITKYLSIMNQITITRYKTTEQQVLQQSIQVKLSYFNRMMLQNCKTLKKYLNYYSRPILNVYFM
jgi:hypothetical protein